MRAFWLTILGAALGTIMATSAAWIFLLNPVRQAVQTGNEIRARFVEFLNLTPRITADNAVLFAQDTPTLELVTVRRPALVRHRFEESWLRSTKTFEIEAPFTARAGFHLRDAITVNIPRGGRAAEVRLPGAKILSIEMGDIRILRDEDGLWNRLTARDREKAMRTLAKTAKAEFLQTDILKTATEEAERQIREIARSAGCGVVFLTEDPSGADREPGYLTEIKNR
ncbi:MAG: DUF4230 domain-containing protein [Terrimicrobiaceae bacterium]|jgi:hypothetical protein|nr:DUF4230 domain-containing protein [Terrimicrobiaceae bacterium]